MFSKTKPIPIKSQFCNGGKCHQIGLLFKLHITRANIMSVLFSHRDTLLLTPYFDRKNGTSFILIHECCFYSKCPMWGECKWTQDICKFTCILREGKWGLVLRFLDQAPWVKAKERGVCNWITENFMSEKGEERCWLPYSSQHSRTCI